MQKVAIFDIDGTVFRSSLLIEVVEALIHEGLFPKDARSGYLAERQAWHDREGTYDAYIDAVIRVFIEHIKNIHYSDFKSVADGVIELQKHRVYRYTRDLLKKLKDEGYFALAISQSPKTILDGFCEAIGFDKVYGRFYEIDEQDRLTGEVKDLHLIANKANIVKRAVEKNNLTLEGSVGVGDTDGDIQFLELVDTAICFNPNKELYNEAKLRGWNIVVERKNVIYEI